MRNLIIFVLLFLCNSLIAQDFNSVRKSCSLAQIAVRDLTIDKIPKADESTNVKVFDTNHNRKSIDNRAIMDERPSSMFIPFSKPLNHLLKTSSFGYRFHPILKKWRFHSGVDFASNTDTVYSILSGQVKESGYSTTLGYYIRTVHSGGKLEILYAHLSQYHFLKGEQISAGEPLGITGSTGLSTGDHLHLAVYEDGRHVDPISFMSKILLFNNQQNINYDGEYRYSNPDSYSKNL